MLLIRSSLRALVPSRFASRASACAALAFACAFAFAQVGAHAQSQATCIPGVTATVEPACAPQGEPVLLTVHNGTGQFLVLPSSCLWQAVFSGSCGGPFVVVPYCLWILTFIPPGESMSSWWDQRDQDNNQVAPGTYVFSVPDLCCVPFEVCGTCAEPPHKYGPVSVGSGGQWPRIETAGGMPTLGNSGFRVAVSAGLGGAPGFLLIGAHATEQVFGWGSLLVAPAQPFLALPIALGGPAGVPGAGSFELPAPIPSDPAFLGFALHFQYLLFDAQGPDGLAHSQGMRVTVCGG
jgi:hypothetical protein